MTTQEVLSFLKEQGINFSLWRLKNLIKRGIIKEPTRMHSLSKRSPMIWSVKDIIRIKLFIILDECKKRHEALN